MTPISKPIVCYVTDRASLPVALGDNREEALITRVRAAATAGVDWIELREKDLDSRTQLDLTRKVLAAIRAASAGGECLLLLNDRIDLARVAGTDGVHLAETSLPVGEVARWRRQNKFLGADGCKHEDWRKFSIGVSCHSQEGAQRAARDGADYIFFGPVFATPSKAAFGTPQGLIELSDICRSVKIPVLAIGGITNENAGACMETGAAGIAAIGLFQRANDLGEVLADLRKRLSAD